MTNDFLFGNNDEGETKRVFSVGEYLDLVNQSLQKLSATVQGEISQVGQSGRAVYFTLSDKDEDAVLNCLCWTSTLRNIGIELEEGMEVKVTGYPEVYKPKGRFSFRTEYIIPVGEGALRQAFEKLKTELEQAGYFKEERKRPLPRFVEKIGLITSQTGAAITDFTTHLGDYGLTVNFYDARVEGVKAVNNIVDAIKWFNEHNTEIDVLVVTRGGGSLEALQAFNTLEVAKAIYGSKIPVLSAVGHERDITIADLVADTRASTPTHAGEMLTANWDAVVREVGEAERHMATVFMGRIGKMKITLTSHQNSLITNFGHHLSRQKQIVENYSESLSRGFSKLLDIVKRIEANFVFNYQLYQRWINETHKELRKLETTLYQGFADWHSGLVKKVNQHEQLLNLSDPQHKLKQGYSIVKDAGGKVVKSTKQVRIDDIIGIRLYEGGIQSQVKKIG